MAELTLRWLVCTLYIKYTFRIRDNKYRDVPRDVVHEDPVRVFMSTLEPSVYNVPIIINYPIYGLSSSILSENIIKEILILEI